MMGARDSITGSASVRRYRSMTVAMRLPPVIAGLITMYSNTFFELEKRARQYSVGEQQPVNAQRKSFRDAMLDIMD
jgi:hypothetical protein